MGFFSNLIKKASKFIVSIFRDVEKPVKKTEDTALKTFKEFQEFIEKPIEKIEEVSEEPEEPEEPEEVEKIQWYRKTVKTGGSDRRTKRTDTWESFYAITWEDNTIDRTDDLLDWLQMEFPNKSFHESGYEKSEIEETDEFPEVTFPEIIGGTE